MKGIQSNGFLPIIAQAIAEMEELHGEFAGINEINLAELGRRTGISRAKLRRLKANGFCETPHGLICSAVLFFTVSHRGSISLRRTAFCVFSAVFPVEFQGQEDGNGGGDDGQRQPLAGDLNVDSGEKLYIPKDVS